MKKAIFTIALLGALNLHSQSAEDLTRTGDQLYLDGFASLSWAKYEKALDRTKDDKLKFRLLINMSKTAKEAGKLSETLNEVTSFITSSGSKLEKAHLASLILNASLMQLELSQYNKAFESCMKLKKEFAQLPAAITNSLLETAVFALVKASKAEEASKLIEEYQKSFTDQTKMDLENARLKIMLSQYVNAITILGKYIESKDPLPHFLSMWAYLKSGDTNKSYEIYNKYLSAVTVMPDPAFTGVIIKLAESTFKDKSKEAVALLDKANTLESNVDMKAYISLKKAELQVQAGMNTEAITELESFLKLYPKSNRILQSNYQLAELYFRSEKQDLAKASGYLNTLIDANPANKKLLYKALVLRAEVKQAIGALKDSAGDFTSAAELAAKEKLPADDLTFPLLKAGIVKYIEAESNGQKEAFNDAANSFYSAASVKSSYRAQAALMQIQSLRRAESYTMAVKMAEQWLKIFPLNADINYLYGLSLLEDEKIDDGIKAIRKFIISNSNDSRVPMAYVHALKAAVYSKKSTSLTRESEKLIISFESMEKRLEKDSQFVKQAAPYIMHLKAIFAWKNNYRVVAENLWNQFLLKHPNHPVTAEVYLWLAFKTRNSASKSFEEAIKFYSSALAMLGENTLKGYTQTQLGKSFWKTGEFEKALESLESAIKVYKKTKLDESSTEEFATLLFLSGDLYARTGNYLEKALPALEEAEKLTTHLDVKAAIRGRIADCYFSSAGQLRSRDEQKELYLSRINKAISIFKEIYADKNSSKSIREQALYKLAKCHETLGNSGEKSPTNKDLADAHRYYHELFFGYKDDIKRGLNRDPYFFCRAGYDLARLQLSYDEKDIQSAISTYEILSQSGYPGTKEAGVMVNFLKGVQKDLDK